MIPLGYLGGGPLFDATKYSGLIGWWDATKLTGQNNDQAVSIFTDSSSNGRNLGGSAGVYKTNIRNGLPVVRTSGGYSTSIFYTGVEFTLIFCGYVALNAGNFMLNGNESGSTNGYSMFTDGTTLRLHYPTAAWAAQGTFTTARWCRVMMTGSSGSEYIYLDGGVLATGAATPLTPTLTFKLGGAGTDIGEAIFYNRQLNSTERTEIDGALALKWGF